MSKIVGDAEIIIQRLLETALLFEAGTRNDDEDKEPRVMLQLDKNEKLIESVSLDSGSVNRKSFHERNQTRSSSRESNRNKTRVRPGRGLGYYSPRRP